ncbi:NmrA family NAD(P)-binding protein [Nonomuraea sp. C10]|uniref:NmrA family NAD(P)-binding protein n=1 Tax=Nonomuraea sp. C10 TaxID=2600577 RepID=UPI0011CE32E3|nr:NmrA family NAD(P)-binding protein [Nonomuraea sp. C10]TXK35581.1 NmrA family transcriptional regulator [Nonomuraea sp. C10]
MTILVTGGTGKTGRRIADRLEALGRPVRVGSRTGTPPFDWADRGTWKAALHGARAAYISYYPDVAVPGALDDVRAFTEHAVAAGVERLVLLSGRGEPLAEAAEQVVRESGVAWTIVRCAWFMQNFSEGYLLEPVRDGVIALPAGDVAEPFVDVDDIADVAVAALTEDGHAGRLYELTGPRALTFADVAAELSKATGRDITYVPITTEEYAAGAAEHGVPEDEIEMLTMLFTETLDGRNAHVADGVRAALGRPAGDFAGFARDNAGVWANGG